MSNKPRIAIAGFQLESVSYLPVACTLSDFESVALRGASIIDQLRGTNTVMGGFIKVCEGHADMVPIVQTTCGAAGPSTDEAVEHYTREIADSIRQQANDLDGVLLFLHGACWSPSYPDPEKVVIDAVREALGSNKPIVVALDYHGNVDEQTFINADAAFAYRKSPHTDAGETGERAADCMLRILRNEISPVITIMKPGVLVPSIFSATALEPLATIIGDAEQKQQATPWYLDISVMAGFSYTDAHNTGFSVLAVSDQHANETAEIVTQISNDIYAHREALYRPVPVYSVEDAVDRVLAELAQRTPGDQANKPYVLLEHADRINDSTYVLAELISRGVKRAAVPLLWDPTAARQAAQAGAGATLNLTVGAHSSEKAGPRLSVEAKVIWAGEKVFHNTGTYMTGLAVDLGVTALLDINGIQVSVCENSHSAVNGDPFYIFDQKPEDFDIIVLRSKTHFRSFYEPIAREILIVDTPDYGPADLNLQPFHLLDTTRVFPFNEGK